VDFELDGPLSDVRDRARNLATQLEPIAVELDEATTIDPRAREAVRNSGLAKLMVPSAYGGSSMDLDPVAICLVREAIAGYSSHVDALLAMQGIGSFAISMAGSDEQRARWLPAVASMDAIAALALSEPDSGSDLKNISTRLTREGGDLRIDGIKSFISNGGCADFLTTLVKEDDGLSLVLIPAATLGVSTHPIPELIATHVIADVRFSGVRLPASARIGMPGSGLDIVLATLSVFRGSVGAASVGIAQRALAEAVRHTTSRVQFGRPLIRHDQVASMLAESWMEIEMSRLLVYRAACRVRQDARAALTDSSMAKLAASEMACRVVDRCIQVCGRFGLLRDSVLGRLYRQVRALRIYEGSSEILKLTLARALPSAMHDGSTSITPLV
jgi:acyl-CoA dehydrogenase